MERERINLTIIIGGPGASGSSTISKMIANYFKLNRVYGGQIMRDLAKEYGYTDFNEFLKYVDSVRDSEMIDEKIDNRLLSYYNKGNIVIESKSFAGYATKNNLICTAKIWLTADIDTRVRRELSKQELDINLPYTDSEYIAIKHSLEERYRIDKERYMKVYGIDYDNPNKYNDIVMDTSHLNEIDTFNLLLKHLMDIINNNGSNNTNLNNNNPVQTNTTVPKNTGEQYEVKVETNPEDLDLKWDRWRCLVCNYLYEGVKKMVSRKCPRCGNEDPTKFVEVD